LNTFQIWVLFSRHNTRLSRKPLSGVERRAWRDACHEGTTAKKRKQSASNGAVGSSRWLYGISKHISF
jgi:hypothetical protein